MIGPDHYLEAERYLRLADDLYRNGSDEEVTGPGALAAAMALAHAQLAEAAAFAEDAFAVRMRTHDDYMRRLDQAAEEWRRVLVNDPDPELEGAEVVEHG